MLGVLSFYMLLAKKELCPSQKMWWIKGLQCCLVTPSVSSPMLYKLWKLDLRPQTVFPGDTNIDLKWSKITGMY